MNAVWVFCRVNDDGHATDLISAHITKGAAQSAERLYRSLNDLTSDTRTDIFEVEFSA